MTPGTATTEIVTHFTTNFKGGAGEFTFDLGSGQNTIEFSTNVTDAAYVRSDHPDTNYGSDATLHVHAGTYESETFVEVPSSWSSVAVNVSSFDSNMTLSLYDSAGANTYNSFAIHWVDDDLWTLDEDAITWNTKPAISSDVYHGNDWHAIPSGWTNALFDGWGGGEWAVFNKPTPLTPTPEYQTRTVVLRSSFPTDCTFDSDDSIYQPVLTYRANKTGYLDQPDPYPPFAYMNANDSDVISMNRTWITPLEVPAGDYIYVWYTATCESFRLDVSNYSIYLPTTQYEYNWTVPTDLSIDRLALVANLTNGASTALAFNITIAGIRASADGDGEDGDSEDGEPDGEDGGSHDTNDLTVVTIIVAVSALGAALIAAVAIKIQVGHLQRPAGQAPPDMESKEEPLTYL